MQCRRTHPLGPLLVVVTVLATALGLVALPAAGQETAEDVTPARVDGRNRFETAANIATLTYEASDVAVVVTGQNYPDALAGSFAAGAVDGPVLLVARDGVPAATWDTLDELGVSTVVMIGGSAAISEAVEVEMTAQGYTVDRISGVNRFQTASAVAMRFGGDGVGTLEGDRTAILASGESFPDALSAGPLAAAANLPLFLTPRDGTEASVNRSLEQLGIERILVMGGTGAVSSDVVTYYQARGYEVERFAGRNRMETATVIADNAVERFDGFSASTVLLARGDDYPDALTASIHGAALGAPLLLTATPTILSGATEAWLADACPEIEVIRAIGGTGAVAVDVLRNAVLTADRCPALAFCTNVTGGYTVSYPDTWVTNIESIGLVPACSLFDPDPAAIRQEGQHLPADIGVYLRVVDVDFDEAAAISPHETERSRSKRTVDGRTAVRLETEATGAGMHPAGTLQTRWVVDLGDETLIGVSFDVGKPDYAEKQAVFDGMMKRIDLDD